MTWVAWLDKQTGDVLRVAHADEPTPEYTEATHDRVPLSDDQYQAIKAGHAVDRGGRVKSAPRAAAKSAQEVDAEIARSRRTAAQQFIARMPPGFIDLLAERVAEKLAGK